MKKAKPKPRAGSLLIGNDKQAAKALTPANYRGVLRSYRRHVKKKH